MDARDQLRRYLEQRRDMGERDLVLDGLAVDDVLRMMGAVNGSAPRTTAARERDVTTPERSTSSGADAPGAAEGDWRKVLDAKSESSGAKAPKVEAVPVPPTRPPSAAQVPATSSPDAAATTPPLATGGRTFTAPTSPDPSSPPPPSLEDTPQGITVGTSARAIFGGALDAVETLDGIAQMVRACSACGLVKGAKNAVPGEGNPNADFVLVGEAPGQNEDESGRPFIGQAGQLLTKILEAIKLSRDDVYICNVIKHRPPNNRNPLPEEIAACSPFLRRQIELLRPKVILALGTFAAQTLLETKTPIGKLRGQMHRYYGVPLVATYHPAALLRNPSWKRPTWEDVQLARRILDRASGA